MTSRLTRPVLILGAGGHSKVLQEALRLSGAQILGVYDQKNEELVFQSPNNEVQLVNGVGGASSTEIRMALYKRFKAKGYSFASVIHPSAVIATDVTLGEGVQIMAGAVVQPGARIGENSIVNTRASVDHDCEIGSHVHLAPGCTLSGGVKVGYGSHIGAGATLIQSVEVGEGCMVGAGAIVIRSLASNVRAWGVPAQVKENPSKE